MSNVRMLVPHALINRFVFFFSDALHDPVIGADILSRCGRLLPLFRDPSNYRILNHSIGLRPARDSSQQRVEIDSRWSVGGSSSSGNGERIVVHAYGHGGDGFQSSWGTATVVLHTIMQARPMLFQHNHNFHTKYSQLHTGILQRAGVKHPFIQAKL